MNQEWREMAWCQQCRCERRITGLMGLRLVSLSTCGHVVGRPTYHDEWEG